MSPGSPVFQVPDRQRPASVEGARVDLFERGLIEHLREPEAAGLVDVLDVQLRGKKSGWETPAARGLPGRRTFADVDRLSTFGSNWKTTLSLIESPPAMVPGVSGRAIRWGCHPRHNCLRRARGAQRKVPTRKGADKAAEPPRLPLRTTDTFPGRDFVLSTFLSLRISIARHSPGSTARVKRFPPDFQIQPGLGGGLESPSFGCAFLSHRFWLGGVSGETIR